MPDLHKQYLESVVNAGGYSSQHNLHHFTKFLFDDLSQVKTALDVGGGFGVLSFYLASQGVEDVICLEPMSDGSDSNAVNAFKNLQAAVPNGDLVEPKESTNQDFDPGERKFDLIVCANAINHVEEEACEDLLTNEKSYQIYIEQFNRLFAMLNIGGRFIATDCTRYNFFPQLGIKNPMVPNIEWEKHQSPYQWTKMLQEVGFVSPKIQWKSPNSLGKIGRPIWGNFIANYFTFGHFKFTVWKP